MPDNLSFFMHLCQVVIKFIGEKHRGCCACVVLKWSHLHCSYFSVYLGITSNEYSILRQTKQSHLEFQLHTSFTTRTSHYALDQRACRLLDK